MTHYESQENCLVWFRQDLRLTDNPALHASIQSKKPVICLYIHDDDTNNLWKLGSASKWWLHHSLKALNESLKAKGNQLIIAKGNSHEILKGITTKHSIKTIYWNRLYDEYHVERDKSIKADLKKNDYNVLTFNSALLHEPWTIKTQKGNFYKVYSPFAKNCFEQGDPSQPLPEPKEIPLPHAAPKSLLLNDLNLLPDINWDKDFYNHWTAGEKGATEKLNQFLAGPLRTYKMDRDFPAKKGVSKLSPHLHWGEISPRQIWNRVRIFEQQETSKDILKNSHHFLKEILWREFAYHLLYNLDNLPEKALRQEFNDFPWENNDEWLKRWQKGQTGYPIVDSGMRELWQTGWMHNRIRMIVGSFLVKNLRLHWIKGEKWFWDTLVDADLASNAASWQWIAGCGADAAPYFRVFNPILQSKKFDDKGEYIKRYVTELRNLPHEYIHAPWEAPQEVLDQAGLVLGKDYPWPIVDHAKARQQALEAYQTIKKS